MALRGEWWIDDFGTSTYADGDIGDQNHESIAFEGALGFDLEELEPDVFEGVIDRDPEYLAMLLEHPEANHDAVRFFMENAIGDAREYMMRSQGWIRVEGSRFQMWTFDDDAKNRICEHIAEYREREFDEFPDEPGYGVDSIHIEELSSGNNFSVESDELCDSGKSAAAIMWAARRERTGFYNNPGM